jgi:hypothetical protein
MMATGVKAKEKLFYKLNATLPVPKAPYVRTGQFGRFKGRQGYHSPPLKGESFQCSDFEHSTSTEEHLRLDLAPISSTLSASLRTSYQFHFV